MKFSKIIKENYTFVGRKNISCFILIFMIKLKSSTKMGKDVMEILEEILIEKEKKTKEEAKTALNQMETEKTLIKELWG